MLVWTVLLPVVQASSSQLLIVLPWEDYLIYGAISCGLVLFGGSSLTTILPEENGETIPSDATSLAAFAAPKIAVTKPSSEYSSA